MDTTPDAADRAEELQDVRRVRDDDATVDRDPGADAAQVEWEQSDVDGADEPTEDLPTRELQPETQGSTPLMADLGPDGEGDVTASGR